MDVTLRADAPREAGDVGILENGLAKLAISHHNFMGDLDALTRRAQNGEANLSLDARNYPGGLRDIAAQINAIATACEKTNGDFMNIIEGFSRGNFSHGTQFANPKATEVVEKLGQQLQLLKDDIQKISVAAKDGQFNARASSNYAGEWTKVASDMNALVDAIVRPVGDIASALERIEGGTFSSNMSGAFNGEFAKMKSALENINTTFAGHLNELSSVLNDISYGRSHSMTRRDYKGAFQAVQSAVNSVARSQERLADDLKKAQQTAAARPTLTGAASAIRPAATPAPTINRPTVTPAPTINRPVTPAPAANRPMATVSRPFASTATSSIPRPAAPAGGGVNAPPPLPINSGKVTVPSGAHEYNRKDYGKYK
jgi:methyl-accepting chemotaxis protein